jgi:hypothetical protein
MKMQVGIEQTVEAVDKDDGRLNGPVYSKLTIDEITDRN